MNLDNYMDENYLIINSRKMFFVVVIVSVYSLLNLEIMVLVLIYMYRDLT